MLMGFVKPSGLPSKLSHDFSESEVRWRSNLICSLLPPTSLEEIPLTGYPSRYNIIFERSFLVCFSNNSERFFTVIVIVLKSAHVPSTLVTMGVFVFAISEGVAGVGVICAFAL